MAAVVAGVDPHQGPVDRVVQARERHKEPVEVVQAVQAEAVPVVQAAREAPLLSRKSKAI